jgi:hypothetical protein
LIAPAAREIRPPRPHAPQPAELAAHQEMLAMLKDPLWLIAAAAETNQAVAGLAAGGC